MNGGNGGMETYLTIEEVAAHLKLARQTIRKYVLNKSIPYRKVHKSVRFRLSELERWIDEGGGSRPDCPGDDREGDLFDGLEAGAADEGRETGLKTGVAADEGRDAGLKAGAAADEGRDAGKREARSGREAGREGF